MIKFLIISFILVSNVSFAEVTSCPKYNLIQETKTTCKYKYNIPEYCQYSNYSSPYDPNRILNKDIKDKPMITFCREAYTTEINFNKKDIIAK